MNVYSTESLDANVCTTDIGDDHADDTGVQVRSSSRCIDVAEASTSEPVDATLQNGHAESAAEETDCSIAEMPFEVLAEIFARLELKERCAASEVCRRWYAILTDGSAPLDDVVVINLFERGIWKGHVSDNAGSRIRCLALKHAEGLSSVLRHVRVTNSVKIWFKHADFARNML
uniref:F-box domain-containing protein n=1 Tax=Plectus sambesii TaxID=2011161 RepID=A0A914V2R1_9BILA